MLSIANRLRYPPMASLLLSLVALTAVAPAQGSPVLAGVAFTNETGAARDGLTMTFSQPLAPGQPSVVPGGGNIVAPFTTAPGYPSADTVVLSGAVVAPGERVPTIGSMTFAGSIPEGGVSLTQGAWQSSGVSTNTVAMVTFVNMTGVPANRVEFSVLGSQGFPLQILSVSVANGYSPDGCVPTMISGVPSGTATVDLPCCVSGFGGVIGPVQVTLDSPAPVDEISYALFSNNVKSGSALDRAPVNRAGTEISSTPAAGACSIATNLAVDAVFPPELAPFSSLSGIRSQTLYACDGVVPGDASFTSGRMVLTTTDTGPTNIRTMDFRWYTAGSSVNGVPDALYYVFDATPLNGVPNLAEPGVGSDPATLQGQTIGVAPGQFAGALEGIGGSSQTKGVEAGWKPQLGTGDFTVSFWLDRNGATQNSAGLFGEPTSIECVLLGPDVSLRLGPVPQEVIRLQNVIPASGGKVITFVRDETAGEVRGYVDGVLVQTQSVAPIVVHALGGMKVGAVGTWPALRPGMRMDEFRLYRRALASTEIASTFDVPLPHTVSSGPPPEWQSNSSDARFEADGQGGTPDCPVIITRCLGEFVTLTMSSENLGMGWELVVACVTPSIQPHSVTGLSLAGEVLNLDIFSPNVTVVNGFSFQQAFGNMAIPLTATIPEDIHAQLAVTSPTTAFGVATSVAGTVVFTATGSQEVVEGPTTDDGFVELFPGAQPLCGPQTVSFAGTAYSSVFANANGSLTFGAGSSDFSPSPASFSSGPPRLAGLWADLDPSAGGSITARVLLGTLIVRYESVPDPNGNASSFDLVLDGAGGAGIFGYDPDPALTGDALVGLSPGGGASDPGGVVFSSLVGAGLQTGSAANMVYEFVTGGRPQGFYSVVFPNADGSSFIVE